MSTPDQSINPRILKAAREEFLAQGYEKASTNAICKEAGVTSGALYKRYSGKDDLFRALVSSTAEDFKERLRKRHESFESLPSDKQEQAALDTSSEAGFFVNYVYDRFDDFTLLVECSQGSSYEGYLDELVEILVAATTRFMNETGHEAIIEGKKASPALIHIIISSFLYGIFEPVIHRMTRREALLYSEQIQYFFNVGWADILGLNGLGTDG